jgi:hypothetical protein
VVSPAESKNSAIGTRYRCTCPYPHTCSGLAASSEKNETIGPKGRHNLAYSFESIRALRLSRLEIKGLGQAKEKPKVLLQRVGERLYKERPDKQERCRAVVFDYSPKSVK